MDAKQPGKGVYRVEFEPLEDDAGNAATELASYKHLPGQPVVREMSPLASTASGQHPVPPAPELNRTPPTVDRAALQRTLHMENAPPKPPAIPLAQPRAGPPVPYLQTPAAPSPALAQPRLQPPRDAGPTPEESGAIARPPPATRQWAALAAVLVVFVVVAGALYQFRFRK